MKTAVTVWNPRVGVSSAGVVSLIFLAVTQSPDRFSEAREVAVEITAAAPTIVTLDLDDVAKLHGRRLYLTDDDGRVGIAPILY